MLTSILWTRLYGRGSRCIPGLSSLSHPLPSHPCHPWSVIPACIPRFSWSANTVTLDHDLTCPLPAIRTSDASSLQALLTAPAPYPPSSPPRPPPLSSSLLLQVDLRAKLGVQVRLQVCQLLLHVRQVRCRLVCAVLGLLSHLQPASGSSRRAAREGDGSCGLRELWNSARAGCACMGKGLIVQYPRGGEESSRPDLINQTRLQLLQLVVERRG
jgi:hypothetical protein